MWGNIGLKNVALISFQEAIFIKSEWNFLVKGNILKYQV